jgi:hypothetical protein
MLITDMSRSFALRARVINSKAPKVLGNGNESLKMFEELQRIL